MRARSLITVLSVAAAFLGVFSFEANSQDNQICRWRGKAPFCQGNCRPDETMVRLQKCVGGSCCTTGSKAYCCKPR